MTIADIGRVSAATGAEHGNSDVVVEQCAHKGDGLAREDAGSLGGMRWCAALQ